MHVSIYWLTVLSSFSPQNSSSVQALFFSLYGYNGAGTLQYYTGVTFPYHQHQILVQQCPILDMSFLFQLLLVWNYI